MGKQPHDASKWVFLKPETLLKIIRLTKFPAFMLTISCSALLVTMALKQLPQMFTITVPGHECTFLNLSHDEQQQIQTLLQKKTQHLSFFNGVEQLGQELLTEIPALAGIRCSLDRDKKLHVVATGKKSASASTAHVVAAHTPTATKISEEPKSMVIQTAIHKPFNELFSTQQHSTQLISQSKKSSAPYRSSLLNQQPPSFNPEILVSDTGN